MTVEDKIIEAVRAKEEIRIKDLAKLLGKWEGNVSRKVSVLAREGTVEKFVKDGYTCVRLKKRSTG